MLLGQTAADAAWQASAPASASASVEAGAEAGAKATELSPVFVPLPPAQEGAFLAADSSAAAKTLAVGPVAQEGGQARALFSRAPGVQVAESGGFGQLQRLSVRGGAGNAVAVLVDGISWGRIGEGVDLALLPMALLERAHLIKGAAGARLSPGAMTGALDFGLSKQPGERLFAELLGGSFGTVRGLAGGSGAVGPGQLTTWVQAMHSAGNFRYRFDPTPNLPRDSFVSQRRHNNDADTLDALVRYAMPLRRWQLESWLHAGLHKRGLAGPVENPSPSARQRSEALRLLVRAQGPLGGGSPLSLELSGATHQGGMRLEGGSFGEGLVQRDSNTEFAAKLGWERGPHAAFVQGSLRHERLVASEGGRAERLGLGGMAGGEAWLWGQWALNGFVRVDKAGPFANPSAKLGSLWLLPRGFALSANAGRSFRIPSFFELYLHQGQVRPNPELLAERAWSFDGGLSWEGERARVAAGYFGTRFQNLIQWEYLPPFALKPFNLGRAQTQGVELEASWGPAAWLHLEGAYGWLKAKNLQRDVRYAHKPLPFRPAHQLFLRAQAGPRCLVGFVEWHFQSSQTRNSFGNLSWPSRSLLNAGLKSQWLQNPNLQVGLSFRNLLNTHSQDMAGYPLPPRAVFLSLSLALDRAAPPSASSSRFSLKNPLALEPL